MALNIDFEMYRLANECQICTMADSVTAAAAAVYFNYIDLK